MVTRTKHIIAALVGAALMGGAAVPAAGERAALQFLTLGAGARAAAMGEAFTTVPGDLTAASWNPATLGTLTEAQISILQNNWLVNTNYQHAGAAVPFGRMAAGVNLYRMDFGAMDRYENAGPRQGQFEAESLAGGITIAGALLNNVFVGINAKMVSESIEEEKASSFAGDAGFLVEAGHIRFGAAVQHIGPGVQFVAERHALPTTARAGMSVSMMENRWLAAFDVSKALHGEATGHAGFEYSHNDAVSVRGGYRLPLNNTIDVAGLTGLTAGIGFAIGLYHLDYAFMPFGDLGSAHRVALSARFNRFNY